MKVSINQEQSYGKQDFVIHDYKVGNLVESRSQNSHLPQKVPTKSFELMQMVICKFAGETIIQRNKNNA